MNKILEDLNALGCRVLISNLHYRSDFSAKCWWCKIEVSKDGVEIKSEATLPSLEEAVSQASFKFYQVVKDGAPNMVKPLLEAPKIESEEDEVPF